MGGTNRKKRWALGTRHSIQQRLRPKSLDSQTPARFSSLGLKKKTYMWLEVENQEGEKTSAKKPRPLDLNQLSLMLIHIHTISHMINFRILRPSPMPHHSVSQENKLEVVREDPLHEKCVWAMLIGGLCLWSSLGAGKPAWRWTSQKPTHRDHENLCQMTSSAYSLPWHCPP